MRPGQTEGCEAAVSEVEARIAGVLLAAGGGSRLGRAKAFVQLGDSTLLERGVRALADGGCEPIVVVLGAEAPAHGVTSGAAGESVAAEAGTVAEAEESVAAEAEGGTVAEFVPLAAGAVVVVNADWMVGISTSLRTGLLASAGSDAAVVTLVDTPGVAADVIRRLVTSWRAGTQPAVVATYGGEPRNPVVLAAQIWPEVLAAATGDTGARAWLRAHPDRVTLVECSDIGSDADIDTPAQLAAAEEAWASEQTMQRERNNRRTAD
jgi:CTP:molybdopterin cytidylyltransferase MocA